MSNKHFPPSPVGRRSITPAEHAAQLTRQNQPLPPRQEVTPTDEPCPCCRATIARPEEELIERIARWLYQAHLRWLGAKPAPYDTMPHAAKRQWLEQAQELRREAM